jgi:hypothetical protein
MTTFRKAGIGGKKEKNNGKKKFKEKKGKRKAQTIS